MKPMSWYSSIVCPGVSLFEYDGREKQAWRWIIGTLLAYGLLGPIGFLVHAAAVLHARSVEKKWESTREKQ